MLSVGSRDCLISVIDFAGGVSLFKSVFSYLSWRFNDRMAHEQLFEKCILRELVIFNPDDIAICPVQLYFEQYYFDTSDSFQDFDFYEVTQTEDEDGTDKELM